jgi:hypothetical protein
MLLDPRGQCCIVCEIRQVISVLEFALSATQQLRDWSAEFFSDIENLDSRWCVLQVEDNSWFSASFPNNFECFPMRASCRWDLFWRKRAL